MHGGFSDMLLLADTLTLPSRLEGGPWVGAGQELLLGGAARVKTREHAPPGLCQP